MIQSNPQQSWYFSLITDSGRGKPGLCLQGQHKNALPNETQGFFIIIKIKIAPFQWRAPPCLGLPGKSATEHKDGMGVLQPHRRRSPHFSRVFLFFFSVSTTQPQFRTLKKVVIKLYMEKIKCGGREPEQ